MADPSHFASEVIESVVSNEDTLGLVLEVLSQDQASVRATTLLKLQEQLQQPDLNHSVLCACLLQFVRSRVVHLTHRAANDSRVPESPASARHLDAHVDARGGPGTPTAAAGAEVPAGLLVPPPACSTEHGQRQQPESSHARMLHGAPRLSLANDPQEAPPRALHGTAWPALPTPPSGSAPPNPFAPSSAQPKSGAGPAPVWPTPTESQGSQKARACPSSQEKGWGAQQLHTSVPITQPSPSHSEAASTGALPSPCSTTGAGDSCRNVAGQTGKGGMPVVGGGGAPALGAKLQGAWAARGPATATAAPLLASISGKKQDALARRLQGDVAAAQQGSSTGRGQQQSGRTAATPASGSSSARRVQPVRAGPANTPSSSNTMQQPPPGFSGVVGHTSQPVATPVSNLSASGQSGWPSLAQTQGSTSSHSFSQSGPVVSHSSQPSGKQGAALPSFPQRLLTPASAQSVSSAAWPALGGGLGGAAANSSQGKQRPRRITPQPQLQPCTTAQQVPEQQQPKQQGPSAGWQQVNRQGSVEEPQTPASSSSFPRQTCGVPAPTPSTPAPTLPGAGDFVLPSGGRTTQPMTSNTNVSTGSDLSFCTAQSQGALSAVTGTSPMVAPNTLPELAMSSQNSHQGSLSFSGFTGTPSNITGAQHTTGMGSVTGRAQPPSPLPALALLQTPAPMSSAAPGQCGLLLPSPGSVTSRIQQPSGPAVCAQEGGLDKRAVQDSTQEGARPAAQQAPASQPAAADVPTAVAGAAGDPALEGEAPAVPGTVEGGAVAVTSKAAGPHAEPQTDNNQQIRLPSMGGSGLPEPALSAALGAGFDAQGQLLAEFSRLARAHATLLSTGCIPLGFSLHEEVMLLITLLSLPPTTPNRQPTSRACSAPPSPAPALPASLQASRAGAGPLTPSWPAALATTYACAVLDQCPAAVCGMGRKLCGLLLELPTVRMRCPGLATALETALAAQRAHAAPFRPYDQLTGVKPVALVGLLRGPGDSLLVAGAGTNGSGFDGTTAAASAALAGKPQGLEAQRRAANRERVRDAFFSLARDASALAAALAQPTGGSDAVVHELRRRSGLAVAAAGTTGAPVGQLSPAALVDGLLSIRARSTELLAATHPENLPFLAELFTGCVLQAAATGEAVMDSAVASLAQRDTAKFQRLSQRLQAQGASSVTPAARTLKPGVHTPHASGGSNSMAPVSGQQGTMGFPGGAWDATPGTGGPTGGAGAGTGSGTSKDAAFALSERLADVLRVLPEFGGVQHGYVLFLEACDSRALSLALGKCMAAKLHALLTSLPGWEAGSSGGGSATAATAGGVKTGEGGGARDGGGEGEGEGRRAENGGAAEGDEGPDPKGAAGSSQTGAKSGGLGASGRGAPAIPAVAGLSPKVLSEQVVAMVTLSCFLSYLTHSSHQATGAAQQEGLSLTALAPPGSFGQMGFGHMGGHEGAGAGAVPMCAWPGLAMDLPGLLESAMRHGMLPAILPCVAHLLGFAHTDPHRLRAGPLKRVLLQLCVLRASPALSPSYQAWGDAAACVRSILDDLLARLAAACPAAVMEAEAQASHHAATASATAAASASTTAVTGTHSDPDPSLGIQEAEVDGVRHVAEQVPDGGAAAQLTKEALPNSCGASPDLAHIAAGLSRWDGLVDARLLEVCCPGLDTCCAALQRAAAALAANAPRHAAGGSDGGACTAGKSAGMVGGGTPGKRDSGTASHVVPRKISVTALPSGRVSQPVLGAGAVTMGGRVTPAAASLVPPGLAALLQAPVTAQGGAQLQLQQALLAQYSTDEQPVKLKEVVGYMSDLLAVNAVTAAMPAVAPRALSDALAQLSQAASQLQADIVQKLRALPASQPLSANGSATPNTHLPTSPLLPTAASAASTNTRQYNDTPGSTQYSTGNTSAVQKGSGGLRPAAGSTPAFTPAELERVKGQLSVAAEDIAGQAVRSLLEAAEPMCRSHICEAAKTALPALLPPTLPPPARHAASLVVTHNALVACAHRLVSQVPPMVRHQVMQQVEPLARSLLKQAVTAAQMPLPAASPSPQPTTAPSPTASQAVQTVQNVQAGCEGPDVLQQVPPIRTSSVGAALVHVPGLLPGLGEAEGAQQQAAVRVVEASPVALEPAILSRAQGTQSVVERRADAAAAASPRATGSVAAAPSKPGAALSASSDDIASMSDQTASDGSQPASTYEDHDSGSQGMGAEAMYQEVEHVVLHCVLPADASRGSSCPDAPSTTASAPDAAAHKLHTRLLPVVQQLVLCTGNDGGGAADGSSSSKPNQQQDLLQAGASSYMRQAAAASASVLHAALTAGELDASELEAVLCAALSAAAKRHVPGTWPGVGAFSSGMLPRQLDTVPEQDRDKAGAVLAGCKAGSAATAVTTVAAADQLIAWIALEVLQQHASACRAAPVWHGNAQLPRAGPHAAMQAQHASAHASKLPVPMLRLPGAIMELARDVGEFPLLQGVRLAMQTVSLGGLGFMG